MKKAISILMMFSICVMTFGCNDTSIRSRTFTPQPSYEFGSVFTLNLADYFDNAQGAVFETDRGSISDGILTINLTEEGMIPVKVTASKDGKTATLSFTLNVVSSGELSAKTFHPDPSYSVDTDFVLNLYNYFNNSEGAVFESDKGTISEGILTIELKQAGSLPVKVTARKDGKTAELNFTLNVVATWNFAPTVTGIFFDDFSQGVDPTVWEVSSQKWGLGVGASPNNVFYSKDTEIAAAEGCESGGIVVMRTFGDYKEEENLRRQGAVLVTRDAFGPGKFEVRAKIVPRLGQCTAFWTYWNGGGTTKETNRYSEIDIEMPMNSDYRKWSGTTYKYFVDWQVLAERGTVTAEKSDGVNDGQWHVWAFEWRTDDANGDNKVVWYLDGKKMFEIKDYTPEYTASFWIGNWFPADLGWVGVPNFEEAYMYIDWVRITQYNDPIKTGLVKNNTPGGLATDLGSNPIPRNQYVANSTFKQVSGGNYVAWDKSGTVTGGGSNPVAIGPQSKLTQIITAQYPGYSFDLKVDGRVSAGGGKLKVYVQYMFGSVARGKSDEVTFDAGSFSEKTLSFTIPKNINSTDLRIVLETEAGTTAEVRKVEMYMWR